MRKKNSVLWMKLLAGMLTAASFVVCPTGISASSVTSVFSSSEESQILPIPDGSGKYLLKSDGFFCLNEDGTLETTPAVHYFDHFEIDGSVFDGYYYHDESGKFRAENPHMVYIKTEVPVAAEETDKQVSQELIVFDGYYMVNSLGKLSAAPQVRYMDHLEINKELFQGFYYFDEYGKMVTQPGIHTLHMTCNGRYFEGSYYFGGAKGELASESGVTPEGFSYDENGYVADLDDLGMDTLKNRLEEVLNGYEGEWCVYVKDLSTNEKLEINNQPLYSASLIKAFVLAKTYADMELVKEHLGAKMNADPSSDTVQAKIDDLLWNMITVSDNESFNELVRLQSEQDDFLEGAVSINEYLEREGYKDTLVQHTLSPSSSPSVGLGENNITSVRDCALLLERIYNGVCVNRDASQKMLNLLLNQEITWKIPEGLKEGIVVANKTGETETDQHDIAIVYGENSTYILCVMSENCPDEDLAVDYIRYISKIVYNYLNARG